MAVEIISPDAFIERFGQPSGALFSRHTKICKLLTAVENAETSGAYRPVKFQDLIFSLDKALDASVKDKLSKNVLSAEKKRQLDGAVFLRDDMQSELNKAKVSRVFDLMARHGTALVFNSGTGLIDALNTSKFGLAFTASGQTNASMTRTVLNVNPAFINQPDAATMPIFVHEYHHYIARNALSPYQDEFFAHWKEYTVAGRVPNATTLNHWLLDDLRGYKFRAQLKPGELLTRPEDALPLWNKFRDNKKAA